MIVRRGNKGPVVIKSGIFWNVKERRPACRIKVEGLSPVKCQEVLQRCLSMCCHLGIQRSNRPLLLCEACIDSQRRPMGGLIKRRRKSQRLHRRGSNTIKSIIKSMTRIYVFSRSGLLYSIRICVKKQRMLRTPQSTGRRACCHQPKCIARLLSGAEPGFEGYGGSARIITRWKQVQPESISRRGCGA